MNFKIRKENVVFWIQIIGSACLPVLAYFGLTGADLTTWGSLFGVIADAVMNPYVLMMFVLGVWNAVNDPTTPGVRDSEHAMGKESLKEEIDG